MAAKWWEPPRDALDTLTLTAVDMPSMDAVEQTEYMPFDPIIKRTEGTVRELATGKMYKTTKGAPHVILKLVLAARKGDVKANEALTTAVEDDVHSFGLRGIRTLAVAKTNDKDQWEFLGMLTFLDPPRPDTKQTIEDANKYGVAVKMITGDHLLIARETARVLGMGDYVKTGETLPLLDPETKKKPDHLSRDHGDMCLACDGFAQVFPEHKYLIVECLRELGFKVGMTGDGVNDAPALKRADVGVAVQGATDAARAAADIVLTQPGLSTIVNGIIISRRIFVRIKNFLTYRIAATLQLLVFFFISVLALKPRNFMPDDWETKSDFPDKHEWPEFFHMPVLMLMLITLLNDGTLIAIGYDRVEARDTPEKWNLTVLYIVSSVLAFVALASSIILLFLCLDSWNSGFLGGLSYGQITSAIYLKVSISDFLTLFSARTNENWFWTTAPAPILMGAGALALTISTIIACTWPETYPDGVYTEGLARRKPYEFALYIWLYCIAWWFLQDACKVLTFYILKKYNLFGYNDTGRLVMPASALQYIRDNKEKDMNPKKKSAHH
jgi:H+-transporting ATPase